MDKPEALRLADELEMSSIFRVRLQAAAELRRLHQFAEDQIGRATAAEAALQMTKATYALKLSAVEAQRDALLEALKDMLYAESSYPYGGMSESEIAAIQKARAAIKAVEGA